MQGLQPALGGQGQLGQRSWAQLQHGSGSGYSIIIHYCRLMVCTASAHTWYTSDLRGSFLWWLAPDNEPYEHHVFPETETLLEAMIL